MEPQSRLSLWSLASSETDGLSKISNSLETRKFLFCCLRLANSCAGTDLQLGPVFETRVGSLWNTSGSRNTSRTSHPTSEKALSSFRSPRKRQAWAVAPHNLDSEVRHQDDCRGRHFIASQRIVPTKCSVYFLDNQQSFQATQMRSWLCKATADTKRIEKPTDWKPNDLALRQFLFTHINFHSFVQIRSVFYFLFEVNWFFFPVQRKPSAFEII